VRELARDLALALRERVLPHLLPAARIGARVPDVRVASGNPALQAAILSALDAGFLRVSG
jgi:hypothetical protein